MNLAISIEQEEIEEILRRHYATTHGFKLNSFHWTETDSGHKKLACGATSMKEHAAPAAPLKINEAAVEALVQKFLALGGGSTAKAAEAVTITGRPSSAMATYGQQKVKKSEAGLALNAQGLPVSWIENATNMPVHPSEDPDTTSQRVAKLQRLRAEAGGISGKEDQGMPSFHPMNPPEWAKNKTKTEAKLS